MINRRGCVGPSGPSGTRTCRLGVRTSQSGGSGSRLQTILPGPTSTYGSSGPPGDPAPHTQSQSQPRCGQSSCVYILHFSSHTLPFVLLVTASLPLAAGYPSARSEQRSIGKARLGHPLGPVKRSFGQTNEEAWGSRMVAGKGFEPLTFGLCLPLQL